MLENEGINKIQEEQDREFAEKIQSKYQQQPMIRLLRKRVANCRKVSYGFQFFSLATLAYFVYWISSDYNGTYFGIVLSFLLALSFAWEFGKRYAIIETFDGAWNPTRKWKMWFAPLVVLLIMGSIAGSYIGGDQFMKNETAPPILVYNPQIDSLRSVMAEENTTIKKLQNTTWKGSITRTASSGIKLSKELQLQREAQLATLLAKDETANLLITKTATDKKAKLGFLTGFMAGLMDILLLILLGVAENMETQADKLLRGQGSGSSPSVSVPQNNASNIAQNHYTNMNSTEHRKIGFEIPKGGFDTAKNRVNHTDTETTHPETQMTRNPQSRVAPITQPDTEMTRVQKDPEWLVKMIKRLRVRWARSCEGYSGAIKNENTRRQARESALEDWRELEELGYKIEVDTSENPWTLLVVSPQKQKRHG